MAKTRHGLGRGLDALLGTDLNQPAPPQDARDGGEAVREIEIRLIDPNRDQPRRRFDEQALKELSDSIKSVGVIQPIIVSPNGDRYQIVAGERRWRAARAAGLDVIPALVRDMDTVRRLETALIENLQRDDLNPMEEAAGVKRLMEQCGYTQEQAAVRLGKSRPAVANLLRLNALCPLVQEMLRDGRLSAGHGRALASIEDEATQQRLANLCAAQGWSVRQLEKICREQSREKRESKAPAPRDPACDQLEHMARDVFGTRAQLDGDANRGRLILHYFSADDLERIWEILECVSQARQ